MPSRNIVKYFEPDTFYHPYDRGINRTKRGPEDEAYNQSDVYYKDYEEYDDNGGDELPTPNDIDVPPDFQLEVEQ